MSFASNLLGAVVGGAIEYVALITGYQALAIAVAVLYAAAYAAVRWFPRFADRDLEVAQEAQFSVGEAETALG